MTSHPRSHLMLDSLRTTASFTGPLEQRLIKTIGSPNLDGALGRHLGEEIQPIQVFCPLSEKTPG